MITLRRGAMVLAILVTGLSIWLWLGYPSIAKQWRPMAGPKPFPASAGSRLESGRLRVCGGLLASLNRSWQLALQPGKRPAASFKGMAPLAAWPAAEANISDRDHLYLAAVAPHDGFWLGFEADSGMNFAVSVDVNGRNALSGELGESRRLQHNPRNYLLIPDQPWLDAVVGHDGKLQALTPSFTELVGPMGFATGAEIHLGVYAIPSADLEPEQPPQPKGPLPYYGQDSGTAAAVLPVHPWQSRSLRRGIPAPRACAHLTLAVVEPHLFERLTKRSLPEGLFGDADTTPPPPPPRF